MTTPPARRSKAERDAIMQMLNAEFDILWAVWRRTDARARAKMYFVRLRGKGKLEPFAKLLEAARYDVAKWERDGREPQHHPYLATWLNENPLDGDRPKVKTIKYVEHGYRAYAGGPSPDEWYEQRTEAWKCKHAAY